MKFDFLVSHLINEAKPERKTYSVRFSRSACDKYGLKDAKTTAHTKKQAISLVISSQLKDKVAKEKLGLVIWDVNNNLGAEAKEKIFVPQPIKYKEEKEEQMNLPLESFDKEKKEGLHGWFSRNHGKGWVNCKRSKPGHIVPCGRKKGSKGGKGYPACRPTLSMCSGSKAKKKSHKAITWKKKK
jgi:hypothetical protein